MTQAVSGGAPTSLLARSLPLKAGEALGIPVRFCAIEEMIWSKGYIMERERFDGAEPPRTVRPDSDVRGDYAAMVACAWDRPSIPFGSGYARFDREGNVPRLPGPPYLFISRVIETSEPAWKGEAGVTAPPGNSAHGTVRMVDLPAGWTTAQAEQSFDLRTSETVLTWDVTAPITVSYNLSAVKGLQLSADTLAGIFEDRASRRFAYTQRPVPSHHRSFTRSMRLALNT